MLSLLWDDTGDWMCVLGVWMIKQHLWYGRQFLG